MAVTYSKLRLREFVQKKEEKEQQKFNFDDEYAKLIKERDKLESEIKVMRKEMAKVKNDFAEEYDKLTREQQEIMDEKCRETKDINEELARVTGEIKELKTLLQSNDEVDGRLRELKDIDANATNQESLFIEELSRYTKALIELGSSTATTGNELLLTQSKLPKFRRSNQKEAAQLAQSMYALKMVLVKRYAESVSSGCNVQ